MKRRNFLAGLLILPALVKSFAKEDPVMPESSIMDYDYNMAKKLQKSGFKGFEETKIYECGIKIIPSEPYYAGMWTPMGPLRQ